MYTQGLMESKTLNKHLLEIIFFINGAEHSIPEEDIKKIYEDGYKAYKLRKILITSYEGDGDVLGVEINGLCKIIPQIIYNKSTKVDNVIQEWLGVLDVLRIIKKTTYNEEDEIEKIEYSLELENPQGD